MDNNIGFIFCLLYCYKMLPILICPKSRFLLFGILHLYKQIVIGQVAMDIHIKGYSSCRMFYLKNISKCNSKYPQKSILLLKS